jgi:hypothetical protein
MSSQALPDVPRNSALSRRIGRVRVSTSRAQSGETGAGPAAATGPTAASAAGSKSSASAPATSITSRGGSTSVNTLKGAGPSRSRRRKSRRPKSLASAAASVTMAVCAAALPPPGGAAKTKRETGHQDRRGRPGPGRAAARMTKTICHFPVATAMVHEGKGCIPALPYSYSSQACGIAGSLRRPRISPAHRRQAFAPDRIFRGVSPDRMGSREGLCARGPEWNRGETRRNRMVDGERPKARSGRVPPPARPPPNKATARGAGPRSGTATGRFRKTS